MLLSKWESGVVMLSQVQVMKVDDVSWAKLVAVVMSQLKVIKVDIASRKKLVAVVELIAKCMGVIS